uniref:Uncharacterized protein n=1 Tax=Peronospora matthiolae TaxID=2874970 RepID=A0AAV1V0E5_9STRA
MKHKLRGKTIEVALQIDPDDPFIAAQVSVCVPVPAGASTERIRQGFCYHSSLLRLPKTEPQEYRTRQPGQKRVLMPLYQAVVRIGLSIMESCALSQCAPCRLHMGWLRRSSPTKT